MKDLTGYTDAELSMFVFNTAEYYNHMLDFGLLSVTNKLNSYGVKYTPDQWDMLCRDYHDDQQELAMVHIRSQREDNA